MEVVQYYTERYHEAMRLLNVESPSIEPRASGHVIEQIEAVKKILAAGYAYESNGSVYFDVQKYNSDHHYGVLSGRTLEATLEGTRSLDGQGDKRAPYDFALWKKAEPEHIMRWPSPWGEGFPGWHLECSVMGAKYLGEEFDIHGGGMDLLFPHHECEIAQNVASRGTQGVHYWIHNNMITIGGQKMGKSLGNFITLPQLFSGEHDKLSQPYSPMTIRFFILQAHYRSTLDFSNEALQAAEKGYKRLMQAWREIAGQAANGGAVMPDADRTSAAVAAIREAVEEALCDDLNTPVAIAYGAKHVDRAGYRAEQDARAAMSYLLRHPERYPIDRNYLFVAGSSAGGITSLNLAFMTNDDIPNSAKAGPVNEMVTDLRDLLGTNNNQRRQVGLEDLGDINKVANDNGGKVDFTINAVVNMWGAVHKIEMIDHSQTTAILSFHGDADQVVPYGYDRPFSQKEPLNKLMCNKMYGSKCVHDRAKANGMQQELHTKAGAGHGLHADCGQLTDYFYYITENATRFFYLRIFPRPAVTMSREGKQQWFTLENAGEVQECRWEAVGGVVLEAEPDRVRAMFFNDKEEHTMRVVGQQKNGQSFVETYNVD